MSKFGSIGIFVTCIFFIFGVFAINANGDKPTSVNLLVDSESNIKYELTFPVPSSLSCDGYFKDLKNTYTFRTPSQAHVSIMMHALNGFTKERLEQIMSKNDHKPVAINGKRFLGFINIFRLSENDKNYHTRLLLYMDNRFLITIDILDTPYDDIDKLQKDICASLENTKVLDITNTVEGAGNKPTSVTFSVDSATDSNIKDELTFPVPSSLSCDGRIRDLKNIHSFYGPSSAHVSIIIVTFTGITKEILKQMMDGAARYKGDTKPIEINGKRFLGYADIFKYKLNDKNYNASVLLYMDNRFLITIDISNTAYDNPDDMDKLLKDIYASLENTKILDANGNAVSARHDQSDKK